MYIRNKILLLMIIEVINEGYKHENAFYYYNQYKVLIANISKCISYYKDNDIYYFNIEMSFNEFIEMLLSYKHNIVNNNRPITILDMFLYEVPFTKCCECVL